MKQRWKVILYPGLIAAFLFCASPAAADGISGASGQNVSGLDDGVGDLPPSDLAGWFQTFDPSNQWTDAANIATMEARLALRRGSRRRSRIAHPAFRRCYSESGACRRTRRQPPFPNPVHWDFSSGALAILGLYAGANADRPMSRYAAMIDPAVIDYILTNSVNEPDLLARLRQETASHPKVNFQVPPEQGQFLRVLTRMTGVQASD